jgi:hypothetical protein
MKKKELIFGSIGYTILYNKLYDCEILLLSDNHDEIVKQCNRSDLLGSSYERNPNKEDDIQINDYLQTLLDKNYIIMIEEVPFRIDKKILVGLWDNSDHVKNIRIFFEKNIKNKKLIPFDIRFELIDSFDPTDYNNKSLKDYILNINNFFILKHYFFNDLLLYSKKIDDSVIRRYYITLMMKFYKLCNENKQNMNIEIKSIINKDILIEKIQELLSEIMGFYVLLKLYDLININKKIVIYGGLYHIDNIKTLLIKYYDFVIKEQYGKNDFILNDIDDNNQCIINPKF